MMNQRLCVYICFMSSIICLVSMAQASATRPARGAYGGISAGYGFGSSKYGERSINNRIFRGRDTSLKGPVGGAFLGFMRTDGPVMFGVEGYGLLTANRGRHSDKMPGREEVTRLKRTHLYGAAIRLGGRVQEKIMLYGRVGFERARFHFTNTSHLRVPPRQANQKTLSGFAPGVGLEVAMPNHMLLGIEYTHSFYRSVSLKKADQRTLIRFKPRLGSATIRLGYMF